MQVKAKKQNEKLIETQVSKSGVFTLVKDETGVRIVIQNQLACDMTFKNYQDAEKYIESKPYTLILIASHIYNNAINKLQAEQAYYSKTKNGEFSENSSINN